MQYRELAIGLTNRGHITSSTALTDIDYFGRTAPTNAYSSVYGFDNTLPTYVASTGSVARYTGPCMALGIHFDLDSVDVQQSLGDLRLLVMALCQGHRYLIDDLYIWFTGGRGFHVLAKKSFGLSTDTPAKVKRDAESIAGNIKTWDSSVYDRTRLWRVPNSKHGKTGLYKIPLLASEVFCLSMDGIKTLAKKQRSIQDACDDVVVRLRSNAK